MMAPTEHPGCHTEPQPSADIDAWLAATDDQRQTEELHRGDLAARSQAFTQLAGTSLEPAGELRGLPVSIKDNIAIRGLPTRAGSLSADGTPASTDAPLVANLRRAGASIVGHTTMSEYAYAATGLDRQGTCPPNPADGATVRITGGSSSGAAASVADGSCLAAVGTDTAGSIRIPAALCGLVGYVPSKDLIDHAGIVPLSTTLDRVGVIAKSVADCQAITNHMSSRPKKPGGIGATTQPSQSLHMSGLSTPPQLITLLPGTDRGPGDTASLDPDVSATVERALRLLGTAGAQIADPDAAIVEMVRSEHVRDIASRIIAHEAWRFHAPRFLRAEHLYGEWVRQRLRAASALDPQDYPPASAQVDELRAAAHTVLEDADALAIPTVAVTAPTLADVQSDPVGWNKRLLELTTFLNVLGWCAVTVPIQPRSSLPVGLTLAAPAGRDATLLATATWVEKTLTSERSSR